MARLSKVQWKDLYEVERQALKAAPKGEVSSDKDKTIYIDRRDGLDYEGPLVSRQGGRWSEVVGIPEGEVE